jgi:hypothetical protein
MDTDKDTEKNKDMDKDKDMDNGTDMDKDRDTDKESDKDLDIELEYLCLMSIWRYRRYSPVWLPVTCHSTNSYSAIYL